MYMFIYLITKIEKFVYKLVTSFGASLVQQSDA